jgi:formate dehydrogenase major subunit/arsenite oxidase large subunit
MKLALNLQYREEVVVVRSDGTIERSIKIAPSEKAKSVVADMLRAWPVLWLGYPPYLDDVKERYK